MVFKAKAQIPFRSATFLPHYYIRSELKGIGCRELATVQKTARAVLQLANDGFRRAEKATNRKFHKVNDFLVTRTTSACAS
jgi:hypothetical protein